MYFTIDTYVYANRRVEYRSHTVYVGNDDVVNVNNDV